MTVRAYDKALSRFGLADEEIARLSDIYMPLSVRGVEDREGAKAVHAARMVVKRHRVDVEKMRKELKADALAYSRAVDAEAKRITGLLQPIEAHLQAEEDAVKKEKARLKAEEEARKKRALDDRMAKLADARAVLPPSLVEAMSDEEFSSALEDAKVKDQERRAREKAEAEAREQEKERLRKEREALEAAQAEQRAKEERLAFERKQLENDKAAAREAEAARIRAEAVEEAPQAAEESPVVPEPEEPQPAAGDSEDQRPQERVFRFNEDDFLAFAEGVASVTQEGRVVLPRQELLQWLEAHEVEGTSAREGGEMGV